nr:hypothetical protein [uncultured Blautia sp.]
MWGNKSMNITLHTSEIEKYLAVSSVVDYNDPWIVDLSDRLTDKAVQSYAEAIEKIQAS